MLSIQTLAFGQGRLGCMDVYIKRTALNFGELGGCTLKGCNDPYILKYIYLKGCGDPLLMLGADMSTPRRASLPGPLLLLRTQFTHLHAAAERLPNLEGWLVTAPASTPR